MSTLLSDDWDEVPTKPEIRTDDEEQQTIDLWMALGRTRTTRDLKVRETARQVRERLGFSALSEEEGEVNLDYNLSTVPHPGPSGEGDQ